MPYIPGRSPERSIVSTLPRSGQLPPRLIVYGIEGTDFTSGEGLSPEIAAAVEQTAQTVTAQFGAGASQTNKPL